MHIDTQRLVIRDFRITDSEDLFEILGDEATMEFLEPAYDFAKTKAFLADFCIERRGAFAAEHKETGKVIGYLLFNEVENGVFEAGWVFNRNFWRQGFAKEALRALFGHGFDAMGAHRIFAETTDGVRSASLMEKMGMRREGILRKHTKDMSGKWVDMYIYGLLSGEMK